MCPGDNDEFATNVPNEPTDTDARRGRRRHAEPDPEPPHVSQSGRAWRRRRRPAPTAGRTARLHFGAASALADVLTKFNCTANDVRISGPGHCHQ